MLALPVVAGVEAAPKHSGDGFHDDLASRGEHHSERCTRILRPDAAYKATALIWRRLSLYCCVFL